MKRWMGTAAAVLSAMLMLSGCDEQYFNDAYEGARELAGAAAEAVPSAAGEASEGLGDLARKMGLKSPDELIESAHGLFNTPSGSAGGSNSAQNGSVGECADKWQEDPSWGGNSADRGTYDSAWNAGKDGGTLTEVTFCRVVDGDTIVVELEGSYSYVRLIGINTPESVAPDEYLEKTGKENTQEGKDASAHSKELLAGVGKVWLEFDEEEYDPYERILAYVWTDTDRSDLMNMLNARILADGYAEPMAIRPNIRHAEEFAALVDDGK